MLALEGECPRKMSEGVNIFLKGDSRVSIGC